MTEIHGKSILIRVSARFRVSEGSSYREWTVDTGMCSSLVLILNRALGKNIVSQRLLKSQFDQVFICHFYEVFGNK